MLMLLVAIAGGCLALYLGGDLLLRGATALGTQLGWSPAIIGFVLVSLGTSAPELFVSVSAAMQGYGDVAAGNVVGSNVVNIGIVLGLGAMIFPLTINHTIRVHQMPMMLAMTVLGFLFLIDGRLGRIESVILLLGAGTSLWWAMKVDKGGHDSEESQPAVTQPWWQSMAFIVTGIALLLVGAEALIWGGVGLAAEFGVPAAVIALTVTSIGTGLPEITATVIAVARRDADLAVGNVVGSNLLNIGLVLGLSGLIAPINSAGVGLVPLVVMLGLTVFIALLCWRPRRISRCVGVALMLSFVVYTVLLV